MFDGNENRFFHFCGNDTLPKLKQLSQVKFCVKKKIRYSFGIAAGK